MPMKNFAILNPCTRKWSDLEGEGRARFCATCKTHVHSIADYSPREWKKLREDSNGHVCGFLGDSPPPPRSRRSILIGALLTAVAPLFAASGRVRFRVIDPSGARFPKASIAVLDSNDRVVQCVESDESGEAIMTGLPLGNSRFAVAGARGKLTLTLHNGKEVKVEVYISPPVTGEVIAVKPGRPRKRHGWLQYWLRY